MSDKEFKIDKLNKAICGCVALIKMLNNKMSKEGRELERLVKERERILNVQKNTNQFY